MNLSIAKHKESRISIFSLLFAVGVYLPFLLPTFLSNIIKPVFIFGAIIVVVVKKRTILNKFNAALFFFAVLYGIATIGALLQDGWIRGLSFLLYILLSYFSSIIGFDKKDIRGLSICLFLGGFFFSLGILLFNPFFGTNWMNRTYLNVYHATINSNQCVYPALIALAAIPPILFIKRRLLRFLIILSVFLHSYVVLLTMSRSGFLCWVCICLYIFIYFFVKTKISHKKVILACFLICLFFAGLLMYRALPSDMVTRLFKVESYSDSSGRFEMFLRGITSTKNIFFGDGVGAWAAISGGTIKMHNLFVNVFMETGLLGLILLTLSILLPALKAIKTPYFVFVFPALFQSLLESGDAYTFWVPIAMLYICCSIRFAESDKANRCAYADFSCLAQRAVW